MFGAEFGSSQPPLDPKNTRVAAILCLGAVRGWLEFSSVNLEKKNPHFPSGKIWDSTTPILCDLKSRHHYWDAPTPKNLGCHWVTEKGDFNAKIPSPMNGEAMASPRVFLGSDPAWLHLCKIPARFKGLASQDLGFQVPRGPGLILNPNSHKVSSGKPSRPG